MKDIAWFCADGAEMTPERWFHHDLRVLGLYLSAADPAGADGDGRAVLLVLLNTGRDDVQVRLPGPPWGSSYDVLLDTSQDRPAPGRTHEHGAELTLLAHSTQVLARCGCDARPTTLGPRLWRGAQQGLHCKRPSPRRREQRMIRERIHFTVKNLARLERGAGPDSGRSTRSRRRPAGRRGTVWTQVVGQFNEIVIETDYPDLTAYERETAALMSDPAVMKLSPGSRRSPSPRRATTSCS